MVTPRVRLALIAEICAFMAFMPLVLNAEAVPSAQIFIDSSLHADKQGLRVIEGTTVGGIRLKLDSSKNDTLKGSFQATIDSNKKTSLDRAYFKARFPWFVEDTSLRVTAGLAPLSWGKGFLFNAGDPVFGIIPKIDGLSAGEYRTATDWMGVLYLPVGTFSFAELVCLPPVNTSRTRGGGRFVLAPDFGFLRSVECGYLFEEGPIHKGYVAMDGSLYFDWYAAASVFDGEYAVSFGLFRIFDFIPNVPLSLRAEGLTYPEKNIQYWYPSLTAGLTDEMELALQGFAQTGTESNLTAGLTYSLSPLKGFTLSASAMKRFEKGEAAQPGIFIKLGCVCSF